MAFEQVFLRTVQGEQYGPVAYDELVQWHAMGRVPANAVVVDAATGEARPVAAFAALAVPPPPMPNASGQLVGSALPPARGAVNPQANWAIYCALFGLLCWFPLGLIALICGVNGLKEARISGLGREKALGGIILGSLELLAVVAAIGYFINLGEHL